MTNDECRAEALKRVEESDEAFERLEQETGGRNEYHPLISRAAHLRQTAAVFAALAGPTDGD